MWKSISKRITTGKRKCRYDAPVTHGHYSVGGGPGMPKRRPILIKTKQYEVQKQEKPLGQPRKTKTVDSTLDDSLAFEFDGLGILEDYRRGRQQELKLKEDCDESWKSLFPEFREMFLRRFTPQTDLAESFLCLDCSQETNPDHREFCSKFHVMSKSKEVKYL